jgi:hypothetical protein
MALEREPAGSRHEHRNGTAKPPATPRVVRLRDLVEDLRLDAEAAHKAHESGQARGPLTQLHGLDRALGGRSSWALLSLLSLVPRPPRAVVLPISTEPPRFGYPLSWEAPATCTVRRRPSARRPRRENAHHGRPLTRGEKETAILRLLDRRPRLPQTAIAAIVGCAQQLVSRVTKAEQVRQATLGTTSGTRGASTTTIAVIADAPRQEWQPLVEASARQEWTAKQTADVVAELPSMTPQRRAAVLEGREPPLGRTPSGELTIAAETVADFTDSRPALQALLRALAAIGRLRIFDVEEIVEALPAVDIERAAADAVSFRA